MISKAITVIYSLGLSMVVAASDGGGIMSFDQMITSALKNGTSAELGFIEEQLLQLDKLDENQRKRLRAFITDIALREKQDIYENQRRIKLQSQRQAVTDKMDQLYNVVKPADIKEAKLKTSLLDQAMNSPISDVNELIKTVPFSVNSNEALEIPVVHNMLSQLVFLDVAGRPFPIEDLGGGSDAFNLSIKTSNKNVVSIEVKKPFSSTNASVYLKGLNLFVPLKLVANGKQNSTRITVRMRQMGPNSDNSSTSANNNIPNSNPLLIKFANATEIPVKAKRIDTNGFEADIYLYEGYLYVITPHRLRNPPIVDSITSTIAGVNNVYQVRPSSTLSFGVDYTEEGVIIDLNSSVFDVAASLKP